MFVHKRELYAIGTDKAYGRCVIRKSFDSGKTWTNPTDKDSGLLLDDAKYHCAPTPIVEHNGRYWRAMEDAEGPGGWGSHFRSFMMSASLEADLLKAENWTCTNRMGRNPDWLNKEFGGWLEGNAVIAPDGSIMNILRVDYRNPQEKAAIIHISSDGTTSTFDPSRDFISFPGGCKKFTIKFDPQSKLYWTLSNAVLPAHTDYNIERTRNAVSLMASQDLYDWKIRCILLYHPDVEKHGFQYLDWLFENEDIIAVSRTAYDDSLGGADNQHNANFLTFHRFENFRTLGEL